MKRMFVMFLDPDMGGNAGGGVQSAAADTTVAPQTDNATTDGNPGAGSPDGSQTEGTTQQLYQRLEKGERLSPEDLQKAMSAMSDDGVPDKSENTDKPVVKPEDQQDPIKSLPEKVQPVIAKALQLVGAKDLESLVPKMEELVNKDRTEGGRIGRENVKLNQAIQGQMKLIRGMIDGNPEAMATARGLLKLPAENITSAAPAKQTNQRSAAPVGDLGADLLMTDEQIQNSLDPEMAKAMNGRMKSLIDTVAGLRDVVKKLEPMQQQFAEQTAIAERERANAAVMGELTELAEKYKDVFGIESGNVRELLNDFAKHGNIDPRIKDLIATAQYMVDNNLPSIDMAFRAMYFDKMSDHTPAVIAAKQNLQSKIFNRQPTVGAAGGANGAKQIYTQALLQDIADKKAPVPKEWYGPDGLFDIERVPVEARQVMGF